MKSMLSEALCIVRGLLNQLLTNLEGENGEEWLGEFKKFLRKEPCWVLGGLADSSIFEREWQEFYKKLFGIDLDFSKIAIPKKPGSGCWRLLIIVNTSLESLFDKCKELFPCWRWTDDNLDKIVTENERDAKNGAYAVWVKDEVEADENLKNLSADHIKTKGITTETLAERLIHELKFFDETSKHLDIKNITLLAGSRYSGGGVPGVDWDGGELGIYWSSHGYFCAYLRSRQVVS